MASASLGLLCHALLLVSLLHNRKWFLLAIRAHELLWLSEIFVSNMGQCGERQEDTIPGLQ